MAFVYPKAKEHMGKGDVKWIAGTIKAILIDTAQYTPSTAHEFLSSVPVGARITTATLAGKSCTDGVFRASNTTFANASGPTIEGVLIYQEEAGGDGASYLLAFLDQTSDGSLPMTLNGGNIDVEWDSGANGIYKL